MALGGFPTGSMTPNDTHMVEGIKVWRGLMCRVSDWKEGTRKRKKRKEGGWEHEGQGRGQRSRELQTPLATFVTSKQLLAEAHNKFTLTCTLAFPVINMKLGTTSPHGGSRVKVMLLFGNCP